MKKIILATVSICVFLPTLAMSQSGWKRAEEAEKPKLMLFHSTNAINLPTSETIQQGDFLYGIQHRWLGPTSLGIDDLWGIDGGVIMRMKLGYAVTDDILVQAGRTNYEGTWDLEVKHNFLTVESDAFPLSFAYNAGGTYLAKSPMRTPAGHMQAYLQVIANTMLLDKSLGIGAVVTGIHNANPQWHESVSNTSIGWYVQYYIDEMFSLNVEGCNVVNGWSDGYDTYSASLELETGGHFFKFIFSNNTNIHVAGVSDGAPLPWSIDTDRGALDNMHFGFQISRNL